MSHFQALSVVWESPGRLTAKEGPEEEEGSRKKRCGRAHSRPLTASHTRPLTASHQAVSSRRNAAAAMRPVILLLFPMLLHMLHSASTSLHELSAPGNVRIDSYNLRQVLRWDPVEVPNERTPVTYTVEFVLYNDNRILCVNVTETQCDFSHINPFWRGRLKVQAQLGGQRSAWSQTPVFQASRNTKIGPVTSLILDSHLGKLKVDFSPPFTPMPKEWKTAYQLYYWKEHSGEEKKVDLGGRTSYILDKLEPLTKYCVQVTSSTDYIDGQLSDTICETTTDTEFTTLQLVMIIVLSFLGFGLFVVGAYLVHRKGCVLLKHLLYPPFDMPSHMREYLQSPPQHAYVESCVPGDNEDPYDELSLVEVACSQEVSETRTEERLLCSEKT
ncbi:interferon gamma receptor 2 isoform X2 [Pseudophryne corroboree]|uniref:interferon gamma receptor 2 isoform X2 n=1 Tax=Pseudophryne corroboree TaxID=495146 RepID=UPI003081D108